MLFGGKDKKKTNKQKRNSKGMETIIGEGTEIEGTINADTSLRIDGKLKGELNVKEDIVIGENGVLEADIEARNITVAGSITGNVTANEKLVIVSTGTLIGDIKMANLIIEDGATFKGKSESKAAITKRFNNKEKKDKQKKDEGKKDK